MTAAEVEQASPWKEMSYSTNTEGWQKLTLGELLNIRQTVHLILNVKETFVCLIWFLKTGFFCIALPVLEFIV